MFKQFFDSLDKFLDILNVGRLIFYFSAGFLTFYPTLMIIKLLTLDKNELVSFLALKAVHDYEPWIVIFGSLVVGFLIATASYTTVIHKLLPPLHNEIKVESPNQYSFSYRYPWLAQKEEEYQKWLIAEFFRFVEIATFVPLGFLLGLSLLFVYSLIYLLRYAVSYPFSDPAGEYAFILVLAVILGLMWFYLWPQWWKPKVVVPIMRIYLRAKMNLIEGLMEHQKQIKGKKDNSQA